MVGGKSIQLLPFIFINDLESHLVSNTTFSKYSKKQELFYATKSTSNPSDLYTFLSYKAAHTHTNTYVLLDFK